MRWFPKNDRIWLVPSLVIGCGVLIAAQLERGFARTWVLPLGFPDETAMIWAGAGLILGILAATWDSLTGTREFLIHRPRSVDSLLRTRLASCAVVMLAWLLIPWIAAWTHESLFGVNAPAGRSGLAVHHAAVASIGLVGFAIGFFASSLATSLWRRLVAGGLLAAGVWLPSTFAARRALVLYGREDLVLLSMLGASVVLIAAGGSHWVRGHDQDRPWRSGMRRWAAPLLSAVAALFASHVLGIYQSSSAYGYWHNHPDLVTLDHGELTMIEWAPDGETRTAYRLEADGQRGKPIFQNGIVVGANIEDTLWARPLSWWSHSLVGRLWYANANQHFEAPRGYRAVLDHRTGLARIARLGDARRAVKASYWEAGVGTVGDAFSPRSRVVERRDNDELLWVADFDRGSMYSLDLAGLPTFAPVELPGEQRLEAVVRALDGQSRVNLMVGENGVFRFAEYGGFEPAEGWTRERALDLLPKHPDPRFLVEEDGLRARIEFWTDGDPSHEATRQVHELVPGSSAQRARAAWLMTQSALRAPALALIATFETGSPWGSLDPLLMLGRRPWLTAASCLLGLVCAALVRWRLRRRGVDPKAVRLWVFLTFLSGLAGLAVALIYETRRAHRGVIPRLQPHKPLLATTRRAS